MGELLVWTINLPCCINIERIRQYDDAANAACLEKLRQRVKLRIEVLKVEVVAIFNICTYS